MIRPFSLICALLLLSGCATTHELDAVQPPKLGDGLRSSYEACLEAAGGVVPASQGCIEREDDYQRRLLVDAEQLLRARDDAAAIRTYQTDKRQWDAGTALQCRWDAETEGQGQRLAANDCALRRLADWVVEARRRLR